MDTSLDTRNGISTKPKSSWTTTEDRILLQALKNNKSLKDAWQEASSKLEARTPGACGGRYYEMKKYDMLPDDLDLVHGNLNRTSNKRIERKKQLADANESKRSSGDTVVVEVPVSLIKAMLDQLSSEERTALILKYIQ